MTFQSPRIYIYKITFEEVPYYYYGVKKEEYYNQEYWGSPKTNKWCWELYTPKKQILELFDYTNEGYIEAQGVEKRLIKPVYTTDKWCLNRNCGGLISPEMSSYGGKKGGKTSYENKVGIHAYTPEERSLHSKKIYERGEGVAKVSRETLIQNGKTSYELKLGVHGRTKEKMSEDGKKSGLIGGKKVYELGVGIHGRTKEQMTEDGKKGGQKTYELGIGLHALTPEQKSENAKKSGQRNYELGIGIHALTPEQRSENGKKAAKTNEKNKTGLYGLTTEQRRETARKINSQRWKCTETGHISTPGGLTYYQRKRGIDTSKRVRLE
jgi:hypothetical protein